MNITFLIANNISINNIQRYNITPVITYYLDEKSTFNHQTILSNKFTDSNKSKLMFGYKFDATLWIKFTLVNLENHPIEKILEYDYPTLREFTLYDLNTSNEYKGGFLHAKKYRGTLNQLNFRT